MTVRRFSYAIWATLGLANLSALYWGHPSPFTAAVDAFAFLLSALFLGYWLGWKPPVVPRAKFKVYDAASVRIAFAGIEMRRSPREVKAVDERRREALGRLN